MGKSRKGVKDFKSFFKMNVKLSSFLPYERYSIAARFDDDELKKRLASSFSQRNFINNSLLGVRTQGVFFEGSQRDDRFMLSCVRGRSSFFSPVVDLVIRKSESGSVLDVKMRLSYLVMLFMGCWLGFSGLIGLLDIYLALFEPEKLGSFTVGVVFPWILFFWGYLVCLVGFKLDSHNITKYLNTLIA
jgi:hypothetical protein